MNCGVWSGGDTRFAVFHTLFFARRGFTQAFDELVDGPEVAAQSLLSCALMSPPLAGVVYRGRKWRD